MAFFPNFSDIDNNIRTTLNARKGNPLAVSNLNVWVKMTSAVGGGLILYSNPDFKLFKAAGDGNISTIYGGNSQSGVLGVDWANKPIYASDGLGLYPRPVVTSIEIDEGAGNISRKATISMTAFTKGQAELLSEYFLEPGYTVFFEFGWNTEDSVGRIVPTTVKSIAEMQDITKLINKRANSNGTYENYLGYITGGNISLNGTSWDITINLTGFTEIPLYLKTHEGLNVEEDEDIQKTTALQLIYKTIGTFEPNGLRMFKMMFNDLPPIRQTEAVKALASELSDEGNFINFDEKVREVLNTVSVKIDGDEFKPTEGTKIVDDERFIRFGAMMKILQASIVSGFKLGDIDISVIINSSNPSTQISAFPNIFSLDRSKLFIPNPKTPKFTLESVTNSTKKIVTISTTVDNSVPSKNSSTRLDNSLIRYFFPNRVLKNRDGSVIDENIVESQKVVKFEFPQQTSDSNGKEDGYWGYLDDLYVNFDFFKNVISTSNFDIRNVLYTILNGLSSAAGNIWDFQITEQVTKDDTGNTTGYNLSIIDLNFVPKTDEDGIYEFDLMGEQSIFISNTFDMDIGGAMMNQIIGKRIGLRQSDSRDISPEGLSTGLFTKKTDKILPNIQKRDITPSDGNPPIQDESTDEEIKNKNIQSFLDSVGIYPRVNNHKQVNLKNFESQLYFATNTDKQLFDELRNNTKISKVVSFKLGIFNIGNGIAKNNNPTPPLIEPSETSKTTTNSGEYSTLLPIKFSFKIHGVSGIKRGDKFKVKGLPDQYYKNGFFQVTAVKHSVSGMKWETDVEGSYRRAL